MNNIKIVKAFGKTELFSEEKLRRPLKRSGSDEHVITSIVDEVVSHLRDGMSTKEIYKQAFDLLRQYSPPHAARYRLKQAINNLGPSCIFNPVLLTLRQNGNFHRRMNTKPIRPGS